MSVSEPIFPGDHIEVTPLKAELGTYKDWGLLRGTSLSQMSVGGTSIFWIEPALDPLTKELKPDGLRLNANDVEVRLLFSARVARTRS